MVGSISKYIMHYLFFNCNAGFVECAHSSFFFVVSYRIMPLLSFLQIVTVFCIVRSVRDHSCF